MALVITSAPEQQVNGHNSKWSAVHHPIVYKYQRQDQEVSMRYKFSGQNSTTKIKLVGDVPSVVQVGHRVQYHHQGNVTLYNVIAVQGNTITTDAEDSGTFYGGFVIFVDSYLNYHAKIEIRYVNSNNQYQQLGFAKYEPDTNGLVRVVINEYIKTLTTFQNEFEYNVLNWKENGLGGEFRVLYKEYYNGEETTDIDSGAIHFWTNSAKQLLELYGSNMGEYVPTMDDTRENKAKFLSVFNQPTYFEGFPFSLSFIYSDNLLNYQVTREEERLDVNNTVVTSSSDELNATARRGVNRLTLSGSFPSQINNVDVWLETGAEIEFSSYNFTEDYSDGAIFDPMNPIPTVKPTVKPFGK